GQRRHPWPARPSRIGGISAIPGTGALARVTRGSAGTRKRQAKREAARQEAEAFKQQWEREQRLALLEHLDKAYRGWDKETYPKQAKGESAVKGARLCRTGHVPAAGGEAGRAGGLWEALPPGHRLQAHSRPGCWSILPCQPPASSLS